MMKESSTAFLLTDDELKTLREHAICVIAFADKFLSVIEENLRLRRRVIELEAREFDRVFSE